MKRLSTPSVRVLLGSFLVAGLLASVACGGAQPAANPPPPTTADAGGAVEHADHVDATAPTAAPAADAGAPNVSSTEAPRFHDLSKDKKIEVMATKVVPNVGKLFKEYNATKFEKFGCVTCHGPQKKDDPHNVLPKLALSGGGFEKLSKTKPELMKFMAEKVTPTMAAALGEKPFDPATKQGFGCGGCHTVN